MREQSALLREITKAPMPQEIARANAAISWDQLNGVSKGVAARLSVRVGPSAL
jgi:hypothetical protein